MIGSDMYSGLKYTCYCKVVSKFNKKVKVRKATIINHHDVFQLSRKTNKGFIAKTPIMTWMEMAMLRKLTSSPGYREFFGNPKNYRGKSCWSRFSVPC